MDRRGILRLICRLIAATSAAVLAVPAVQFVIAPLRRKRSTEAIVQRVARLDDLPVDQPRKYAVTGQHRDAWTVYPQQSIGGLWLIRTTDEDTPVEKAKVQAYSSICPHLGCAIQMNGAGEKFLCPCHNAVFERDGKPTSDATLGYKNPTPRGMDDLVCRIVTDQESEEAWVEVEYQQFQFGLTKKVPKA